MSAHSTQKLEGGSGKLALRALASGAAGLIPYKPTTLAVTGGFHSGASLELTEPSYVIGSDSGSDIVLRDPESHHSTSGFTARAAWLKSKPSVVTSSLTVAKPSARARVVGVGCHSAFH